MNLHEIIKQFTYKEIEFVCSNSDYCDSTTREDQIKLFKYLKKLQSNGMEILPYMEDHSDEFHDEYSLAVVILDVDNESKIENEIRKIASKFGVRVDDIGDNRRTNNQVDFIIRYGHL